MKITKIYDEQPNAFKPYTLNIRMETADEELTWRALFARSTVIPKFLSENGFLKPRSSVTQDSLSRFMDDVYYSIISEED